MFNYSGRYSDKFRIQRRYNYKSNGDHEYLAPELSSSSCRTNDKSELKALVCIGKLADLYLNDSPIWKDMIAVMNNRDYLYKEETSEKRKLAWKLEDEIRKIENKELEDKLQAIVDNGMILLKDNYRFYYGSSKWDYIISNEYIWEKNPSGKTFKLSYKDVRYDEATIRTLDKKVRLKDIQRLIQTNINNLAE